MSDEIRSIEAGGIKAHGIKAPNIPGRPPLSVLDLAPISSGSDARTALRNSVDLARHAERLGYHRYWLAEHHLSAGLASSATPVVIGQVAAVTTSIRVGSGATLLGYQTPLSVVEQFATLDAFFPGRIDLGVGRGLGAKRHLAAANAAAAAKTETRKTDRVVDGLVIPAPVVSTPGGASRRVARESLLQQPGAQPLAFDDALDLIFRLLAGPCDLGDGESASAMPGANADLQFWVLGSSAGESAQAAGARGLPFAVNYHVSPATVLEAIRAYRAAFRPSAILARPHVMVSADVVVAQDHESAARIARPYAAWVQGIRRGEGAMPFPTPEEAAGVDIDYELVRDRIVTQFVGPPDTVVAGLVTLARVTQADELVIATNAHAHEDRVGSYELLARAWNGAV